MLWLYASDEARFEQSVRGVLDQLKVRGRKDPKANVFQLLRSRLCDTSQGEWLVILDNADDARVLLTSPSTNTQADESGIAASLKEARLDYIPRCHHGRLLVTSRSRETAQELVYQKDVVAVEPMEKEQALELLCKKLDTWYTEQDATRLAQGLDYMPLALTQAAAYICQRNGRCSIGEYLDKIKECDLCGYSVLDINARDLRRDREANNTIMLTWQISFNHIREVRPSASDLLSLMSFFDRHAIPEALLQERGNGQAEGEEERSAVDSKDSKGAGEGAGTGDPSKRNAGASDEDVEEHEKDILRLRSFRLISLNTDRATFKMHRLVQVATKKWLRLAKRFDRWASQFISNLEQAFPSGDIDNWTTCQSLFPHTMAALHVVATDRETNLQLATLLLRSGGYASEVGVYTDAEKLERRSLKVRSEMLGEYDPSTLRSMASLASTYGNQGRWAEAEKLQVEVMERSKELLRAGHPDTLRSIGNLANTYQRRGRWGEAEKLQVEVMQKMKEVLGEGHPDTLASMGDLASAYCEQGRLEEAEKLQMEVLEKSKDVFRDGHSFTFKIMANLATTYSQQGRWGEAEKLQVEVMERSRGVLGAGHPDTLRSMACLASTYGDQGRLEEAEKLKVELLDKSKEVLRAGHSLTLMSMGDLALMLRALGVRQTASNLISLCVEKSSDALGVDHPDTRVHRRLKARWEMRTAC